MVVCSGLQPTSSFANGGLQDDASSSGSATAAPQPALTKPNGLPPLRTRKQMAPAEALPVEMANGVPEIQPAGPLPEPAGEVPFMRQEPRAAVTVSCLSLRAHYCMNLWIATCT